MIEHRFQSSPADVRRVLTTIEAELSEHLLPADVVMTSQIVLAEVLNNVFFHAYDSAPDGEVCVTLNAVDQGLDITVCDFGREMPDGTFPRRSMPAVEGVDLADLPQGGFGWAIVASLARDIAYARRSGQNILTFRIENSADSQG